MWCVFRSSIPCHMRYSTFGLAPKVEPKRVCRNATLRTLRVLRTSVQGFPMSAATSRLGGTGGATPSPPLAAPPPRSLASSLSGESLGFSKTRRGPAATARGGIPVHSSTHPNSEPDWRSRVLAAVTFCSTFGWLPKVERKKKSITPIRIDNCRYSLCRRTKVTNAR